MSHLTTRRVLGATVAVLLLVATAAWVLSAPRWGGPQRFGVIVPGREEVVGPHPVLRGHVPGGRGEPVEIRLYRQPELKAPLFTRSVAVSGSMWALKLSLLPGRYRLTVRQPEPGQPDLSWARSFSVTAAPVIAAAGDIACDPASPSFHRGAGSPSARNCQELATSDLLVGADLTAVLTLGDEQYEKGQASAFARSFGPTWGRLRRLIEPAPGNHEYVAPDPTAGYFSYFNGPGRALGRAGPRGEGWHSFDIGTWHLIALNSNCHYIGGCGPHSPEFRWLQSDLRAHPARCTLAYWHHPRFSSGKHGDNTAMASIWRSLQAARADVVLVGHDHDYERFAPLDASGQRDYASGIREFVVGTGGKSHDGFRSDQPGSQKRNASTYGVLELTLLPGRYNWRFVPVLGKHFTDGGSSRCHR